MVSPRDQSSLEPPMLSPARSDPIDQRAVLLFRVETLVHQDNAPHEAPETTRVSAGAGPAGAPIRAAPTEKLLLAPSVRAQPDIAAYFAGGAVGRSGDRPQTRRPRRCCRRSSARGAPPGGQVLVLDSHDELHVIQLDGMDAGIKAVREREPFGLIKLCGVGRSKPAVVGTGGMRGDVHTARRVLRDRADLERRRGLRRRWSRAASTTSCRRIRARTRAPTPAQLPPCTFYGHPLAAGVPA